MINNQFGDTSLTKVFVGGLAWETPKEAMRDHFEKFGEILEAVVISDKVTGRSKGYGFVTFKHPESAKKACEDSSPVINGRRANCNLASIGARRPRTATSTPPPQQGSNGGSGATSVDQANHSPVQWYYPAGTPFHPQQHPHAVPFYGNSVFRYSPSPAYIAPGVAYNNKVSYTGGSYLNGQYPQVYPGAAIMGPNTLMPMYPLYQYHNQQHTLGQPAHFFQQPTPVPAMMSNPTSTPPNPVCLAVE